MKVRATTLKEAMAIAMSKHSSMYIKKCIKRPDGYWNLTLVSIH